MTRKYQPGEPVDYARIHWYWHASYARLKRRIEDMPKKLVCQECGGMGGEKEAILDDGTGPWFECGWCAGTGYVLPHTRSVWLREKRRERATRPFPPGQV